jgi:hypothetical protein
MRIIIAGGRDFSDYELLHKECDRIIKSLLEWEEVKPEIEVVSGTANGADLMGENWARQHRINVKRFTPNWNGLGKRAGYVRNEQMALYAKEDNGVLIAFWDGKSKGTKYMIDLAKKHGLKVFVINY